MDRNTLNNERGKYARLYVQVDLTKHFITIFSIKGRHYKIEYEGLRLLCSNYNRFGHYKERCADQSTAKEVSLKVAVQRPANNGGDEGNNVTKEDGSWKVVLKNRRRRRGKDEEAKKY